MTIPSLAELRADLRNQRLNSCHSPLASTDPMHTFITAPEPIYEALLAVAEAAAEVARWHIPHAGGPVLSCADIDRLRALEAALRAAGWAQGGGE